jgi:hypothetical protein
MPNGFDFDSFSLWSMRRAPRACIASGYRLDSQSIFSQSGRPLFTASHADLSQGYGFPKEKPVNHSFEVRRLPSGGYVFLSALSEGKTVATAVEIATEASPRFDVVSCPMLLDDARVVVGIQEVV